LCVALLNALCLCVVCNIVHLCVALLNALCLCVVCYIVHLCVALLNALCLCVVCNIAHSVTNAPCDTTVSFLQMSASNVCFDV
jgi:hypothetical protein